MKIKPNGNYKLLGTNIHLIAGKVYDAMPATNQPDYEDMEKIFVTNAEGDNGKIGFLLSRDEYELVYWPKKDPNTGRYYYSTEPPESFFGELVEKKDKKPGMVYVNDCRVPHFKRLANGSSEWVAHYAFPTSLAKEMSREYPLGVGPTAFEVIQWKNGRLLTIMSNHSNDNLHFRFDFWAGLTDKPKQEEKKENG